MKIFIHHIIVILLYCFFSRSYPHLEPSHWFLRRMAQMTCFRPRKCLLGVWTMGDVIWGKYSPKIPQKGAWIGSFKPKRQNFYIAISPELLIRRQLAIWGRNSDHEKHFVDGPPLPQSKYNMADGRHLKNRYDVIFQWRMFRFRRNSATGCRMTRRLRRNGQDRNRR